MIDQERANSLKNTSLEYYQVEEASHKIDKQTYYLPFPHIRDIPPTTASVHATTSTTSTETPAGFAVILVAAGYIIVAIAVTTASNRLVLVLFCASLGFRFGFLVYLSHTKAEKTGSTELICVHTVSYHSMANWEAA